MQQIFASQSQHRQDQAYSQLSKKYKNLVVVGECVVIRCTKFLVCARCMTRLVSLVVDDDDVERSSFEDQLSTVEI